MLGYHQVPDNSFGSRSHTKIDVGACFHHQSCKTHPIFYVQVAMHITFALTSHDYNQNQILSIMYQQPATI